MDAFQALEERWHSAGDAEQQRHLYEDVEAAEIEFALKYRIYISLVAAHQTERGVATALTRGRMRTRVEKEACIGPPVPAVIPCQKFQAQYNSGLRRWGGGLCYMHVLMKEQTSAIGLCIWLKF